MYQPLNCIALRTIRYSDRHSILTAYSAERGRVSLLVPATAGRSAARYRALTMPMAAFGCMAKIDNTKEIFAIKDIKPHVESLNSSFQHPVKSVVVFFLADFFYSLLREPVADSSMYALVLSASQMLATLPPQRLANLHIAVLVESARVLGIEPDLSTAADSKFFDMHEGIWHRDITAFNNSFLSVEESAAAERLCRMTMRNFHHFRYNRSQRADIVQKVLKYFSLHGFGNLNLHSTDVLGELL